MARRPAPRPPAAWKDHLWWQENDRRVPRRINTLIRDVVRNRHEGIGKPEPLRHDFSGSWFRRITDEHRLVHSLSEEEVRVVPPRPLSPGCAPPVTSPVPPVTR